MGEIIAHIILMSLDMELLIKESFLHVQGDDGHITYLKDVPSDGSCLVRAISFLIYGSEDFHAEIREKVIQNITTIWGLVKFLTILKESVVNKEYKIYYGFMVCSTNLHAVFITASKHRGGMGSADQSWCWPRTRTEGGDSG
ncbi:hypothetical protein AVEN_177306-1 [Araneus ventricosus]|uniref:OTU domain-containing protein n=1 Tax=Araneus ventricosus TaxID=182803 RepID=A0A4Y2C468_ARAVE|nr:hypothetical protein AVEN_177306-1 [Araneus ventricosus]